MAHAGKETNIMAECYENYILIDVSANLTSKKFSKDLDAVIQRATDSGVQKLMVTGTSLKCSKEALRLTRLYPGIIYSTAGIHPHEAKSYSDENWQELKNVAENLECVAIGDCGLDYSKAFSAPDEQKSVFVKHIELAIQLNKPLFITERNAYNDLMEILNKYKDNLPSIVIHNFTGTSEQAQVYIEHGFYLALTGYLCKDKTDSSIRKILSSESLPLEKLLVETNAPFMYPNTRAAKLPTYVKENFTERSLTYLNRYCTFQRNEPCSLPAVVEMIAAFMKKKPEEIALVTCFNAMKLFGLSQ